MRNFEPVAVDENINQSLVKAFLKVTQDNFQISTVNYYTYYCKNINAISSKVTRYYLYILLNEFSRNMYLGITKNIKKRLDSHAMNEVLGPNDEVTLNALFIVELEEVLGDNEVFSANSQITSIEYKLMMYMRKTGYDVRCQYNEMNDKAENGIIEVRLLERINEKFQRQKVKEEFEIIDSSLKQFQSIISRGGYNYFSIRDSGEVYYKFTSDELTSLEADAQTCKLLLTKKKSEYNKFDWNFVRKCLLHRGLRISLWEQGIDDPDDMIVLKRNLKIDEWNFE